jgi:hypothetical protein
MPLTNDFVPCAMVPAISELVTEHIDASARASCGKKPAVMVSLVPSHLSCRHVPAGSPDSLLAVLLNPPGTTSGIRTRNAVASAGRVLGFGGVEIANLCTVATPSVIELNDLEHGHGWADAREGLAEAIRRADGLLAGWGVSGTTGGTRRSRDDQVAWLYGEAAAAGIDQVWMVGSEPRHPSRWHQYVSDRYGRTSGGTFEQRLAQVLELVPITL